MIEAKNHRTAPRCPVTAARCRHFRFVEDLSWLWPGRLDHLSQPRPHSNY